MTSLLSSVSLWGPSLSHAFDLAKHLIVPSLITQDDSTVNAKELYPEIFRQEWELRDDILIYSIKELPCVKALGTHAGRAAAILVNEDLIELDLDILNFMCKNELYHIHANDSILSSSLAILASSISSLVLPYFQSFLPWWFVPVTYSIPYLVASNTYNAAMIIFQYKADTFACQYSSGEELLAAKVFFEEQIEINKMMHKKYPNFFSETGNSFFDLKGSMTTLHLKRVQNELRQRNIFPTEETKEQKEKREKINEFYKNSLRKFEKLRIS